jgi:hypothetical protein
VRNAAARRIAQDAISRLIPLLGSLPSRSPASGFDGPEPWPTRGRTHSSGASASHPKLGRTPTRRHQVVAAASPTAEGALITAPRWKNA